MFWPYRPRAGLGEACGAFVWPRPVSVMPDVERASAALADPDEENADNCGASRMGAITNPKNDHGASYRHYGASGVRNRPKTDICEIFGVVRFSTFSTLSSGKQMCSLRRPMSGNTRS